MTAYQIDVHHLTHTCPANPDEPHSYDIRRTIVAIAPGGACRRPITIRSGDTAAAFACGRHEPRHRQCPACRITVIEHTVTFTHTGHEAGSHTPAPAGLAAHPCRACGKPLAAVLAERGTHLLCGSQRPSNGTAA